MKLRKYINPDLVKDSESIIPMFGIEATRWDELSEAVIAFFDAGGKMSETLERFDDYIELRDEKEIFAVMYMFGVEKGRFEGEEISRERGVEPVRFGRIHRVQESAQWLKKKGLPLTKYLEDFLAKAKTFMGPGISITTGRGIESLIATILKDIIGRRNTGSPRFSNKNKFKKDDFDIPDPNKKPDSKGDEPSKES